MYGVDLTHTLFHSEILFYYCIHFLVEQQIKQIAEAIPLNVKIGACIWSRGRAAFFLHGLVEKSLHIYTSTPSCLQMQPESTSAVLSCSTVAVLVYLWSTGGEKYIGTINHAITPKWTFVLYHYPQCIYSTGKWREREANELYCSLWKL